MLMGLFNRLGSYHPNDEWFVYSDCPWQFNQKNCWTNRFPNVCLYFLYQYGKS